MKNLKHLNLQPYIPCSASPPKPRLALQVWNKAEAALTDALNSTGLKWTINEGAGESGLDLR